MGAGAALAIGLAVSPLAAQAVDVREGRPWLFEVHAGVGVPGGAFDDEREPGVSLGGAAGRPLTDRIALRFDLDITLLPVERGIVGPYMDPTDFTVQGLAGLALRATSLEAPVWADILAGGGFAQFQTFDEENGGAALGAGVRAGVRVGTDTELGLRTVYFWLPSIGGEAASLLTVQLLVGFRN